MGRAFFKRTLREGEAMAERSFGEWMRLQLLAVRIRETIDVQLGEALASAINTDSQDDWSQVHDRLNVVGHFAGADMIREQYGLGRSC